MIKMNVLKKFSVLMLAAGLTFSCSDDDGTQTTKSKTIVETAQQTPQLSILVEALQAADGNLVNLLNDDGPFTVLAPTNDAFQALLDSNDEWNSIADVDTAVLQQVLLNHVISGSIKSTDLADNGYVNSSADGPKKDTKLSLYYNTAEGVVFNGKSTVETADVMASNGVIHIVNSVITLPTIVDFAISNPNLTSLVGALTSGTPNTDFAGILSRTSSMNSDGINPNFTVFAPINSAFEALTEQPSVEVLTQILLHHVVSGDNKTSSDLTQNGNTNAPTLQGDNLIVKLPGTANNIADIEDGAGNTDIGVIAVDIQAINGVIHVINKIAIPGASK